MTSQSRGDIITGLVVFGGIVAVLVAAEASAPILAGIGAVASAGGGIIRTIQTRKKSPSGPPSSGMQDRRHHERRVAVG